MSDIPELIERLLYAYRDERFADGPLYKEAASALDAQQATIAELREDARRYRE